MTVPVQYSIDGGTASAIGAERRGGAAPRRPPRPGSVAAHRARARPARLRVSPATVAAAYSTLQARGLVAAEGRRGTRVAFRPPLATPRPDALALPTCATWPPATPIPPSCLPSGRPSRGLPSEPLLYGEPPHRPALLALARRQLAADGIPADSLAVVGRRHGRRRARPPGAPAAGRPGGGGRPRLQRRSSTSWGRWGSSRSRWRWTTRASGRRPS